MSNFIQTIRQSFDQVEVYNLFGRQITNKAIGLFFAMLAVVSFVLHGIIGLPESYHYLQQELVALNLIFALISVFVVSRPTGFVLLLLFFVITVVAMLHQLWIFGG